MTDEEIRHRFDATQDEVNRRFDATADLIQKVASRLEAHVDQSFADLKALFDGQDARLEPWRTPPTRRPRDHSADGVERERGQVGG